MLRRRAAARPGVALAGAARGATSDGAEKPGAGSRLVVDWIRCDGYGLCGDLVPDVIDLDEWRYPILPSGPVEHGRLHDVQRAIDCCPMKALRLVPASADRRAG